MSWVDCVANRLWISSLYSLPPSLNNVRVLEVMLCEDGPTASLRMNLNEYPDKPPRKWIEGKFNRAQLTLRFFDVRDLEISGWGTTNTGSVELSRIENGFRVAFNADATRFRCSSFYVDILKISGHCDSTVAIP